MRCSGLTTLIIVDQIRCDAATLCAAANCENSITWWSELMLAGSWKDTRQEAVAALRQIASEDSTPLLAGLNHPKTEIRSCVGGVLGHSPGALAAVTEALDGPSARVRLAALQSLAKLKDSAKPAIPQTRGLLQAESRTIREAVASASQEIE
jgi:hypothetical protein